MANRIRGTVSIIDSAGNVALPGSNVQVSLIAFWGSDSTGAMQLVFGSNTADVIVNMASPLNNPNTTTLKFGDHQYLQNMVVKTLTAGTGYLYFK